MTRKDAFQTYKQRAEWVELLFMTGAARRGFNVAKPWGDSARYDVCLEHNGRFLRVQVKCTSRWNGTSYCCLLYAFHQRAYTIRQIDYFAIYIVPDYVWYIFPAQKLIGMSAVVLTPHRKGHKQHRYKEAWDLLRNRAPAASPRSLVSSSRRPPSAENPSCRAPAESMEGEDSGHTGSLPATSSTPWC